MKKTLYTLLLLLFLSSANATTYYWIGGLNKTTFISQTVWTTDPVVRNPVGTSGNLVIGAADVFIFDGTNVGGATVVTGAVKLTIGSLTSSPFGQLKFINGANVQIARAATGTTNITLNGDGTNADDLIIDGTSSLTMGIDFVDHNVTIVLGANATGLISGKVYISPISSSVHLRSFITAPAAKSLVFASGAECYINDSTATSGFNGSVAGSIVFKQGASLYYYTGRSPIGSNSTTQFIVFEKGSNFYIRGSNISYVDGTTAYSSSSWLASKVLANVFVENNASYKADGVPIKMESLTINNGCTFTLHTNGQTPILGDLTVNGNLVAPANSTNAIVMGGSTPQTITNPNAITIPSIVVCDNSDVTLASNLIMGTLTNVFGKVNFTTKTISGTSTFSSRVGSTAATVTGDLVAGSYQITGVTGTLSGNTGLTITGTGIAAGTSVVGFSNTNNTINLSKPILTNGTAVGLSFACKGATLTTAHPGGFDSTVGCVTVTGTKSYGSGTNYVINNLTYFPVGISSTAGTSMTVGNLTLNAPVFTNYNTRINGTLTLNNGVMRIRATDTVRIASGNDIAGAPFSSLKYIATVSAPTQTGVLRIDTFFANKLFPVGTQGKYLPVNVSPVTYNNICVSVFEGATDNGANSGTALNATQKANIVDAIWTINRTSGTGNCDVTLNWESSLEGSAFSGFANNNIGISHYNGTAWDVSTATSANNTTNTVTSTFSSFSPFGVGKINEPLPVKLSNLNAKVVNKNVAINFTTTNATNIQHYLIQRSNDDRTFVNIGKIEAENVAEKTYSFNDMDVANGTYLYRIAIVDKAGKIEYSNVIKISVGTKSSISLYPNPAQNNLVINGIEAGSKIKMVNTIGKEVKQYTAAGNAQTIDITNLNSGVWFIKIISLSGDITTQSFIKQ